jgi:hypothetical protein
MTRFSLNTLAAGVLLAMTHAALADDPQMSQKPGIPTLAQVMGASGVTIAGYLDTSYTYLSGDGTFSSGTADRVFDTERNSFNLHMVDVTVSALPSEGFGGFVELGAGSDAKVIHSAGAGDSTNDFDVTQAYLHYATGPWMLTAGKYVTASGAEVIRSPDDMNFSRSILFGYAIPFTHTGLRGYYTVSDALQLFAGLNNGWDVLKESAQSTATDGTKGTGKTVELGFSSTPVKPLTVAGVYYSGDESAGAAVTGRRDLYDIVATYNITDTLSATMNYDWAKQKDAVAVGSDARWNGLAGYLNYKMNDMWRVSLRAETFDDKDGFRTGVAQKWKEGTLTVAYMPAKNTELRAEARRDWTNADTSASKGFLKTDGNVTDAQDSFGLEAIYRF